MKYCWYTVIVVVLICFMLYTGRNHMRLYNRIKDDDTMTDTQKKMVYTHGVIHIVFALCLSWWFINVSIKYFNNKPYVFYVKIN